MKNQCLAKTILLFIIVFGIFIILFFFTTSPATNKLDAKLESLEKFLNTNLKDLKELNPSYPTGTTPNSQLLVDYDNIFTSKSETDLENTAKKAKEIRIQNMQTMTNNLDLLDQNVKVLLTDANTQLYKQLGKNYERSQQINNIRQDWLSEIDELPYRMIS